MAEEKRSETDSYLAYIGRLLEERLIGDQELLRLIEAAKQGEVVNPITDQEAQVNSALLIHREGLQEYLELGGLDKARVLKWSRENLKEKERVRERREEARQETADTKCRMEFVRVEPGRFLVGEVGQEREVKIREGFSIMNTLVTQWMWVKVMKENPSRFRDGPEAITIVSDGKSIQLQPDHPVEQVSFDDSMGFVERINELSGKDDPLIYEVIPGHQKGDQYDLPTEEQWEYVAKDQGRKNSEYPWGNSESEAAKYAWFSENSGNATHSVGEKAALPINGQPIYDLVGNVWEWTKTKEGSGRDIRGGSWFNFAEVLRSADRVSGTPSIRNDSVGLRLVRTRR
jgi:formylglycine-generating enzyme required for sulfatase activity